MLQATPRMAIACAACLLFRPSSRCPFMLKSGLPRPREALLPSSAVLGSDWPSQLYASSKPASATGGRRGKITKREGPNRVARPRRHWIAGVQAWHAWPANLPWGRFVLRRPQPMGLRRPPTLPTHMGAQPSTIVLAVPRRPTVRRIAASDTAAHVWRAVWAAASGLVAGPGGHERLVGSQRRTGGGGLGAVGE